MGTDFLQVTTLSREIFDACQQAEANAAEAWFRGGKVMSLGMVRMYAAQELRKIVTTLSEQSQRYFESASSNMLY